MELTSISTPKNGKAIPVQTNTKTAVEKLREMRHHLTKQFPERQHVIDGCIAAILSSEHVLLLGPPGTAKSALARSIVQAFGGSYFERLLTKFSTPEEVFGPISLKALEEDRFERKVAGKLPTVEFALVDECFKASSAILNSMLAIMNERIFHNDGQPLKSPLVTLFGASNELPEGKDLEALSDRFLVRFDVGYVTRATSLRKVLLSPDPSPMQFLTMAELVEIQAAAMQVKISDETVDGLVAIRDACNGEGIIASDRRWKKALKLVQAQAYVLGNDATGPEDLSILTHVLWREPKERETLKRIMNKHADPTHAKASEILEAARELSRNIVGLQDKDVAKYIGAAVAAIKQFRSQQAELSQLSAKAGKRSKQTVSDASSEIQGMIAEATRVATSSLGIENTRVLRQVDED